MAKKTHEHSFVLRPTYEPDQASAANRLAVGFLRAARYSEDTASFVQQLADYPLDQLASELDSEARKMAFWLNIYNAYTQHLARLHTDRLENEKIGFFTDKWIRIAGQDLSFDDIENGIIRHSKYKLALGYLDNPFPSSFEKRFRLEQTDWRIHFALNCGAASCPPVRIYNPASIDEQLKISASTYLAGEVRAEAGGKKLMVPQLMMWFAGDFGGRRGIYKILASEGFTSADEHPSLGYLPYDWSLKLDAFAD